MMVDGILVAYKNVISLSSRTLRTKRVMKTHLRLSGMQGLSKRVLDPNDSDGLQEEVSGGAGAIMVDDFLVA